MIEHGTTTDPAALQRLPEDEPASDPLDPKCMTTGVAQTRPGVVTEPAVELK